MTPRATFATLTAFLVCQGFEFPDFSSLFDDRVDLACLAPLSPVLVAALLDGVAVLFVALLFGLLMLVVGFPRFP